MTEEVTTVLRCDKKGCDAVTDLLASAGWVTVRWTRFDITTFDEPPPPWDFCPEHAVRP